MLKRRIFLKGTASRTCFWLGWAVLFKSKNPVGLVMGRWEEEGASHDTGKTTGEVDSEGGTEMRRRIWTCLADTTVEMLWR